jgi:CRP/FNR family transcriptional regulator, cyclic AMP receptor protein
MLDLEARPCDTVDMLTAPSQLRDLVNLFHQGTRLNYKKGEFIIRPGDRPSGLFYISSGTVKVYDITKYGEENLVIIRQKGDILGLVWTVTGTYRGLVYAAITPATVFHISEELFKDYLQKNPAAALPLLDMLVEMYRVHSDRIRTLEYRSVRERLVSFLYNHSERFGEPVAGGVMISVPLRHQDIASSISASRETTSRELAALERLGHLTNEHLMITVKDPAKMRATFLE